MYSCEECGGLGCASCGSSLSERVEARLRAEWPNTWVVGRGEQAPPSIAEGGATDTLIRLAARIVAEEAGQ